MATKEAVVNIKAKKSNKKKKRYVALGEKTYYSMFFNSGVKKTHVGL